MSPFQVGLCPWLGVSTGKVEQEAVLEGPSGCLEKSSEERHVLEVLLALSRTPETLLCALSSPS